MIFLQYQRYKHVKANRACVQSGHLLARYTSEPAFANVPQFFLNTLYPTLKYHNCFLMQHVDLKEFYISPYQHHLVIWSYIRKTTSGTAVEKTVMYTVQCTIRNLRCKTLEFQQNKLRRHDHYRNSNLMIRLQCVFL